MGCHWYTINRYKVVTVLEQLISWAASEITCADNSYQVLTSNSRNQLFGQFHLIDGTRSQLFVQFHLYRQLPKSIVYTIPAIRQHSKSIVWTIPINGPAPKIKCLDNSNQLTVSDIICSDNSNS